MSDIKNLLPNIKTNVSLASYTSLGIGGPADYFYEAKDREDLIKAVSAAREAGTPYFILGGGTNLLVSDEGFRGIIIKIQNPKPKCQIKSKIQNPIIYAEAGISLGVLVSESQKQGLSGLEWAAGIPGTLGGAVRGNAGAFGGSMADVVEIIEAYDPDTAEIKKYKNTDCGFGYKDSIFKKNNNIILSAELKLQRGSKNNIQNKIQENINYRKENHPPYSSCGCIFKNVKTEEPLAANSPEKIFSKFNGASNLNNWFDRVPTGYLIDELGLKGYQIGGAKISEEHGNFIINTGGASAEDIIMLTGLIKGRIRNKYGVLLEEEIEYIGL